MGEMLHTIFNEVVGTDKRNREIAAAPLKLVNTAIETAAAASIFAAGRKR